MAGYRILIADDDDVHRDVLAEYLRLSGYDVVEARDGLEAVSRAETHHPDLVLLDLQMPALDGFGALQAIRERPFGANLPAIFLTSHGSQHLIVKGLELGAEDFVTKPYDRPVLLARVRAALRRADRYREIAGVLEGSLDDIGLDALLQTLEIGQKAATIRLPDLNAEIEVAGARLVACRYGATQGERALARILLMERGRFAVEFHTPAPDDASDAEPLQRSLLRAVVDVDEARDLLAPLPIDLETPMAVGNQINAWPRLARFRALSPWRLLDLLVQVEGSLTENAALLVDAFEKGALRVMKH